LFIALLSDRRAEGLAHLHGPAVDPVVLAAIKGLIAGSVNTALAFSLDASLPGLLNVASALLLGFISYGLGLVLFILARRQL
jgi:hypothetical protein